MTHSLLDWLAIVMCGIALAFISLTMLLRGNDFRRKSKINSHSMLRIVGFTLSGFGPFGVMAWWLLTGAWPSVFMAMFLFGVCCVFITSPNMPPWDKYWKYVTQGFDE